MRDETERRNRTTKQNDGRLAAPVVGLISKCRLCGTSSRAQARNELPRSGAERTLVRSDRCLELVFDALEGLRGDELVEEVLLLGREVLEKPCFELVHSRNWNVIEVALRG